MEIKERGLMKEKKSVFSKKKLRKFKNKLFAFRPLQFVNGVSTVTVSSFFLNFFFLIFNLVSVLT